MTHEKHVFTTRICRHNVSTALMQMSRDVYTPGRINVAITPGDNLKLNIGIRRQFASCIADVWHPECEARFRCYRNIYKRWGALTFCMLTGWRIVCVCMCYVVPDVCGVPPTRAKRELCAGTRTDPIKCKNKIVCVIFNCIFRTRMRLHILYSLQST